MIQKATDIENENAKKKTQSQNVIKAVVLKAKVDKRNSSPIAVVSCVVNHEAVSFFTQINPIFISNTVYQKC